MKKGRCNQNLQLFSPSTTASSDQSSDLQNRSVPFQLARDDDFEVSTAHSMRPRVSACDASELQARVILWLARREMEDKLNQKMVKPLMQFRLIHGPYDGMSLKKSLRVFLEKRKDRIQSSLPYKRKSIDNESLNDSSIGDK